jgi:hypothetical protein
MSHSEVLEKPICDHYYFYYRRLHKNLKNLKLIITSAFGEVFSEGKNLGERRLSLAKEE